MNRAYLHEFRYVALDKELNEICDISYCVEEGGKISYNSLSDLKANCTIPITLRNDEVLELDAVRIYNILNDNEICLGTFFISMPSSSFDESMQSIKCTGYSTLWRIYKNTPDGKYYVAQGTNCIAEIKRILTMLGCVFSIPDGIGTTSVDTEWGVGSSYLRIINDLLDVVNYTSLHVDVLGKYIATPYILPHDKNIDITLDQDDVNNLIEPPQVNELDLFNVPNKFIRYVSNNPVLNLYAVYEKKEGATGTNNTWVNTDAKEVNDVADYDTLYEICKRDCAEATSIYNKAQIKTAIIEIPTYLATIQLNHYKATGKWQCSSYDIYLETGGGIDMNLRKVVTV